jgi:multiple sugar transport system ATP-binding protein
MNFLSLEVEQTFNDGVMVAGNEIDETLFRRSPVGISQSDRVVLGLHPQDFVLADQGSIKGIVQVVERLGHETVIRVRLRDGSESLASLQGQNCDALSPIHRPSKTSKKDRGARWQRGKLQDIFVARDNCIKCKVS